MNWNPCSTKTRTTPLFLPTVLALILALLFLTGCGSTPPNPNLGPTTVEVTKYVPYQCGQPPGVTHVSFADVEFKLVEIDGEVVWTLTAQEYADLGKNTSDTIQAVKEMKAERDFWRKCVRDSLAIINERNAEADPATSE